MPIDPRGPLLRLSKDKQDILAGLALTEIASIVNNSKSRLGIERAGINVMSEALNKLKKQIGH